MKKKLKTKSNFLQKASVEVFVDNSETIKRIRQMASFLCQEEGLELICLESLVESRQRVFRLYIDKPGGVTLDDCANVSRQIGDMLDVEWDSCNSYCLEVSSPGLERPLGQLSDFVRYEGEKIKVKLLTTFNGKNSLCGEIAGVHGNMVKLCVDRRIITLEYDDIAQARLMVLNGDS